MTQRKLTGYEMNNVKVARCALREIRLWFDSPDCLRDTAIHLSQLVLHVTTDGKPYVEPEPPMPDGYRLAVAGDEGRRDCKIWDDASKVWRHRCDSHAGDSFAVQYHYIVLIDQTPTDEDAQSMPVVMVRDYFDRKWEKSRLVRVADGSYTCLAASRRNFETWSHCRHLYPNESS